jgi:lipid-A-disaccharide synthase
MTGSESIFISAGDPSADLPGKNLIDEILRLCPGFDVVGLGGPQMQDAGLSPLADHRDLAVLGFWEIIPKFRFFRKLMKKAVTIISERRPRAVILIDYPGFNLRLARRIRPLGIPIIYYISPQVWAWGGRRISAIRETIDRMLVIFPFEEAFYRGHGIEARFVGHPLVDRFQSIPDKEACRRKIQISGDPLIALLPGSRLQEVKRMLPAMADAAGIIKNAMDAAAFVVAGVTDIGEDVYKGIIGRREIDVRFGETPEIINGADFVIASSGTATIETAYFATPMVVVYKTGFLTYQIARRMITLDAIGMVNIVAGRKIVPELIQREATGRAIARQALDILTDRARYDKMAADLMDVRDRLGPGDAARRAAEAVGKAARLC